MSDEVAIRIDNVSKDFVLPHERVTSVKSLFTSLAKLNRRNPKETQHALRDISFDIKQGEFFGIVGRNGSGKSTLLKIIAGIYQPNKGSVGVNGKIVPFIELGVGFNPELSGRDNIYLNGALFGFSKTEVDQMYDEIVAFAELGKFMGQKLKNYSSGMQVRLAFSLAIKAQADILLIDEVLAVGDADFQRKCYRYFKQLKRQKKTVVFVTHDMDSVREYCDRAMLIDSQQMVSMGSPDDIARDYMKIMTPADQQTAEKAEQADRWGDGACEISHAKIEKLDDKELVFSYVTTAKRDCEDPVFGFRIRNAEGQALAGTNSFILGRKPQPLNKGQHVKTVWKIENVFTEGSYYIDPAVVYESARTAADWWDGAAGFNVVRDRHTPYTVQPRMELEVKNG